MPATPPATAAAVARSRDQSIEPLAHAGVCQRLTHRFVEPRHDIGRSALRRPHRVPIGDVQPRQARLVDGRDVGRGEPSRLGHHCVGPDCAAAHLLDGVGALVEHQVDLAADEVVHRRRAAAVGNKAKLRARSLLEVDGGDLRSAGRPHGGRVGLVGIGLQPAHELPEIARREALSRDDDLGRVGRAALSVGNRR